MAKKNQKTIKQTYYSLDRIKKTNSIFNLIYGEKSNGKSYAVKHECIKKYLEKGTRFILLRRWKEDITNFWIDQYFKDVDVDKLTNHKYDCIVSYRKVLYFGRHSDVEGEEGKVTRYEKIGYTMALSTEQHYSGGSFLDVEDIIFEEFMERGVYIKNESAKLEILYSTIDRKKGNVKVWLVGNSISRVCPYIQDWDLDEIVRKQKQGDIDIKEVKNENNSFTIAVEYCSNSGGKQMSITDKMIDKGLWQTSGQPKLRYSLKNYTVEFTFGFQYKKFKFLCHVLTLDGDNILDYVFFIKPYYREFKKDCVVFSDVVSDSPYWQRDIYSTNFANDNLNKLFYNFRERKIFYSDDLTGTDFKQAIDFIIKR